MSVNRFDSLKRRKGLLHVLLATLACSLYFALSGCSTSYSYPVRLEKVSYMEYADEGYGHGTSSFLFVNWVNEDPDPVDIVEVTLTAHDENGNVVKSGDNDHYTVRLMSEQGIVRGETNDEKFLKVDSQHGFQSMPHSISAYVSKVGYTNGNTWEGSPEQQQEFLVITDEEGACPVALDEVSFYTTSESDTNRYLTIDWHNQSKDVTTKAVVLKVTATEVSGDSDAQQYKGRESFITLVDSVAPGDSNTVYKETICNSFDPLRHATEYGISVYQVVGADGSVWQSDEDNDELRAAFLGRKGCAFGNYSSYPDVVSFVKDLNNAFRTRGMESADPLVFIKPGSHCTVRYNDLDVHVKLDDGCRVQRDFVTFNLYFGTGASALEEAAENYESYLLTVARSVFNNYSSDELDQDWAALFNSGKTHFTMGNDNYGFEAVGGRLYDSSGTLIGTVETCIAMDLTGAFDFDWAKRYPFERVGIHDGNGVQEINATNSSADSNDAASGSSNTETIASVASADKERAQRVAQPLMDGERSKSMSTYFYQDIYGDSDAELLLQIKNEQGSGYGLYIYSFEGGLELLYEGGGYPDSWYDFYKGSGYFQAHGASHATEWYYWAHMKVGGDKQIQHARRSRYPARVAGGGDTDGPWEYWTLDSGDCNEDSYEDAIAQFAIGDPRRVSGSADWQPLY